MLQNVACFDRRYGHSVGIDGRWRSVRIPGRWRQDADRESPDQRHLHQVRSGSAVGTEVQLLTT